MMRLTQGGGAHTIVCDLPLESDDRELEGWLRV
jgi:hypothetical protein